MARIWITFLALFPALVLAVPCETRIREVVSHKNQHRLLEEFASDSNPARPLAIWEITSLWLYLKNFQEVRSSVLIKLRESAQQTIVESHRGYVANFISTLDQEIWEAIEHHKKEFLEVVQKDHLRVAPELIKPGNGPQQNKMRAELERTLKFVRQVNAELLQTGPNLDNEAKMAAFTEIIALTKTYPGMMVGLFAIREILHVAPDDVKAMTERLLLQAMSMARSKSAQESFLGKKLLEKLEQTKILEKLFDIEERDIRTHFENVHKSIFNKKFKKNYAENVLKEAGEPLSLNDAIYILENPQLDTMPGLSSMSAIDSSGKAVPVIRLRAAIGSLEFSDIDQKLQMRARRLATAIMHHHNEQATWSHKPFDQENSRAFIRNFATAITSPQGPRKQVDKKLLRIRSTENEYVHYTARLEARRLALGGNTRLLKNLIVTNPGLSMYIPELISIAEHADRMGTAGMLKSISPSAIDADVQRLIELEGEISQKLFHKTFESLTDDRQAVVLADIIAGEDDLHLIFRYLIARARSQAIVKPLHQQLVLEFRIGMGSMAAKAAGGLLSAKMSPGLTIDKFEAIKAQAVQDLIQLIHFAEIPEQSWNILFVESYEQFRSIPKENFAEHRNAFQTVEILRAMADAKYAPDYIRALANEAVKTSPWPNHMSPTNPLDPGFVPTIAGGYQPTPKIVEWDFEKLFQIARKLADPKTEAAGSKDLAKRDNLLIHLRNTSPSGPVKLVGILESILRLEIPESLNARLRIKEIEYAIRVGLRKSLSRLATEIRSSGPHGHAENRLFSAGIHAPTSVYVAFLLSQHPITSTAEAKHFYDKIQKLIEDIVESLQGVHSSEATELLRRALHIHHTTLQNIQIDVQQIKFKEKLLALRAQLNLTRETPIQMIHGILNGERDGSLLNERETAALYQAYQQMRTGPDYKNLLVPLHMELSANRIHSNQASLPMRRLLTAYYQAHLLIRQHSATGKISFAAHTLVQFYDRNLNP